MTQTFRRSPSAALRRPFALTALALALGLAVPAAKPALAQDAPADTVAGYQPAPVQENRGAYHASPYLPLGHWAYPILDYWISAGLITNLSPFTQPYRRIEIAAALEEVAAADSSERTRGWLGKLRIEFQPDLALRAEKRPVKPDLAVRLDLGAAYTTQTHRDVLRPELDGSFSTGRILEDLRLEFDGQAGVVAYGFQGARKGIYTVDPQYPDGRVVPELSAPILDEMKVRVEEGYLELQTRYARLGFGRQYRNWAPPQLDGFVRSDYAYSQELLGYRVGTERIFLIGSLASYGDFGADTTRYLPMHRLEVRPIDELMIAVSEVALHGGPGRTLDWLLVNPLGVWQINKQEDDYNRVGQLDVWWRPKFGALFGSLLVDATNQEGSCCQMGGSLGFELSHLAPQLNVRANFSAIQSLAYRTRLPWEEYSVERIGIGWDKSDLYLLTAEVDWFARPGLLLRPRLDLQIKGEGDFRELRPDPTDNPDFPTGDLSEFPRILLGQSETTIRPALRGYWIGGEKWQIRLDWDLGLSFIQDYHHTAGDSRTEFTGWLKAAIVTPRWMFRLRQFSG